MSPRYPQFVLQNTSSRYPQDIPQISPRYSPDIPQICSRYPPNLPQISPDIPRFPSDIKKISQKCISKISSRYHPAIPRISPKLPHNTPKYAQDILIDIMTTLSFGHFWLRGVEWGNHNACACHVISFNVFTNRYLLAQSLPVKCDG